MLSYLLLNQGGYLLLNQGGALLLNGTITPPPVPTPADGGTRGSGALSKGRPRHHNLPNREDIIRENELEIDRDDEDVVEILRLAMKDL